MALPGGRRIASVNSADRVVSRRRGSLLRRGVSLAAPADTRSLRHQRQTGRSRQLERPAGGGTSIGALLTCALDDLKLSGLGSIALRR